MAMMIPDPKNYFRQFIPARDSLLIKLENEAAAEDIPIVGPVVGELLFILSRFCGARRILELGTATGYSTIYLCHGCEPNLGHVVTIEVDPAMAERARANFISAGVDQRIEILNAPAQTALNGLAEPFDLVFMDIDKELYAPALPQCHRLLRQGGLLVADNTAFTDARPFNESLFESDQWRSVQLHALLAGHSPEYDGLALALRL